MVEWAQKWYEQNQFDSSYMPGIEDSLYFEGDHALRKFTNYTVLLLLATVIATYGVTGASTATVIGAMLVAPLMTPIMALTLALVRGEEARAAKSLAIVVVSVLAVIALAAVLSFPLTFIDFEENGEITSRVAPGLPAMVVALAAGAAGAFAKSRKEIGDSLPGVAIAISLVPPLSLVGIALAHGQFVDAFGALVLFVTNFLAIILAGGVVFWLSGANAMALSEEQAALRKRGLVVAIGSTMIVLLLLAGTSVQAYRSSIQTIKAQTVVTEWLAGSDYEMVSAVVKYPDVTVTVAGRGDLPPTEELGQALRDELGPGMLLLLRKIARESERFPDAPPSS